MSNILAMSQRYALTDILLSVSKDFLNVLAPRTIEILPKEVPILLRSPFMCYARDIVYYDDASAKSSKWFKELIKVLKQPRSLITSYIYGHIQFANKKEKRWFIERIHSFVTLECVHIYHFNFHKHPSEKARLDQRYRYELTYDEAYRIASKYDTPEYIYNNVAKTDENLKRLYDDFPEYQATDPFKAYNVLIHFFKRYCRFFQFRDYEHMYREFDIRREIVNLENCVSLFEDYITLEEMSEGYGAWLLRHYINDDPWHVLATLMIEACDSSEIYNKVGDNIVFLYMVAHHVSFDKLIKDVPDLVYKICDYGYESVEGKILLSIGLYGSKSIIAQKFREAYDDIDLRWMLKELRYKKAYHTIMPLLFKDQDQCFAKRFDHAQAAEILLHIGISNKSFQRLLDADIGKSDKWKYEVMEYAILLYKLKLIVTMSIENVYNNLDRLTGEFRYLIGRKPIDDVYYTYPGFRKFIQTDANFDEYFTDSRIYSIKFTDKFRFNMRKAIDNFPHNRINKAYHEWWERNYEKFICARIAEDDIDYDEFSMNLPTIDHLMFYRTFMDIHLDCDYIEAYVDTYHDMDVFKQATSQFLETLRCDYDIERFRNTFKI